MLVLFSSHSRLYFKAWLWCCVVFLWSQNSFPARRRVYVWNILYSESLPGGSYCCRPTFPVGFVRVVRNHGVRAWSRRRAGPEELDSLLTFSSPANTKPYFFYFYFSPLVLCVSFFSSSVVNSVSVSIGLFFVFSTRPISRKRTQQFDPFAPFSLAVQTSHR